MDKEKNSAQLKSAANEANVPVKLKKRVGNTTYHVSLIFNENAKEDLTDKINRLIRMECA